jgi:SpoVK/Ycf46/Vps4 family AAA+-type ATPase
MAGVYISDADYLNGKTQHKITYSNINMCRSFFNRINSYLSGQLYYIETQQTANYDKNIKNISCCKLSFVPFDDSTSADLDSVNQRYDVSSISFAGKDLCNVEKRLTDMNIELSYKLPSKFYDKFKKDCVKNSKTLVVDYNIITKTKKSPTNIIKEDFISEYHEISFYPKNKLSLKYFDLFISAIIKKTRKKGKLYLTDTMELTVYINIESFWEELLTRPTRSIDSVYLPKDDKQKIINDIEWFISKETQVRYEQLGRNYKRVILFEGIPGSGKTSFALAIASHFGYDLAIMSFTDKVTDGTFTRLIRQLPEKTVLLLEDIDCLFHERKNNDNYKNQVTFSGILNTLDGIATPHEFICIITTNYKELLDDAILRQGRIDTILNFTYVKQKQIKEIYKAYMGDKYTDELFDAFYNAYKNLDTQCTVSLIQEFLFKYLDNPEKAYENIHEIKELKENSTHKKADVYL